MTDLPASPPPDPVPLFAQAEAAPVPVPTMQARADGAVLIDLTQFSPQPPTDCAAAEPDPFETEIVVCRAAGLSPRLTRSSGPEVDDFGNAIARARIKLSDKAEAEANLINKGVGGWNANGAEVKLKIGF